MSQRTQSTLILLAVFAIGLTVGIGAMVWAWPAIRSHVQKSHNVPLPDLMSKELNLNPDQYAKVQQVYNDVKAQRDAITQKYAPKFNQICDDYTQTRQDERNEFDPVRQQSDAAFRTILSDRQWQKFQSDRSAAQRQRGVPPGTIRRPGGLCGGQGRPGGMANPGFHGGPHPGASPSQAPGGHYFY